MVHALVRIPLLACLLAPIWPGVASSQWHADGVPICTAPGDQKAPLCLSDGAGGAIIVWQDYRVGDSNLYAQHVLASGAMDPAWPAGGSAVRVLTGAVRNPAVVPDGAGGGIVTWDDFRTNQGGIFAQHVTPSGVDPGWPANGVALCTVLGTQGSAVLAPDGSGGAIAAWQDLRSGNYDVYAQHVTASGLVDGAWPSNGRLLCVAGGNQLSPVIAPDGAGGAIVAWGDDRGDGTTPHIYAQHILASGALDGAWAPGGNPLCLAPRGQYLDAALPDGTGGAIAIWVDNRNSGSNTIYDVYAQHVRGSGVLDSGWPADGVAVCAGIGNQQVPVAVPDGAGGAVVAWADSRGGASYDIYAQHLLTSGMDPSWPPDGIALCTVPGFQYWPAIASDGLGGAIVAWEDSRSSGTKVDIYAERALASGIVDPAWPADGSPVCVAPRSQSVPSMVPDGANGAIVAWSDGRSAVSWDIYAQRIFAGGGLAAADPVPIRGFRFDAPLPNPARGAVVIRFDLPTAGRFSAEVFDPAGKQVRVLAADRPASAGTLSLVWDGTGEGGARVGSGLYFIRVATAGVSTSRKVAIVR